MESPRDGSAAFEGRRWRAANPRDGRWSHGARFRRPNLRFGRCKAYRAPRREVELRWASDRRLEVRGGEREGRFGVPADGAAVPTSLGAPERSPRHREACPQGACSRADASGRPERSEPVPRSGAGAMRWCRGDGRGARRPIVTARRDVRPRAGSGLPGCTRPLASGDPCSGRRARQVHVSARAAPGRVEFSAGVRWAVGQASEGACVRALGPPLPSGFGRLPRVLRRPAAGTGRARADRRRRRHGPPPRAAGGERDPRARRGEPDVYRWVVVERKSTFEFHFAERPFSTVEFEAQRGLVIARGLSIRHSRSEPRRRDATSGFGPRACGRSQRCGGAVWP